jgi:crotonobetainyl-CoA:carnitine CoA-transferase CaiB-like acyl-CoA transferase
MLDSTNELHRVLTKEQTMQPMNGIKVLDLSLMAPGPFCTMVLGDLGADVLRIEQPGGGRIGQMQRQAGVSPSIKAHRRSASFDAHNRNKSCICLNLKNQEALSIFYGLSETADVIVEGFRPGVVRRLGVDYDTIKKINPRIIYCSISGYGQDGPYQHMAGHDINYISVAGALSIMGLRGGTPVIPYNLIADYAGGGMMATIGIMAAIMARQVNGKGQYVDISMTDGVLYLMANIVSRYFNDGEVPRPGQSQLNGGAHYYQVHQCKDGKYISIGCIEPWFYQNLCSALGLDSLAPHQNDEAMQPATEEAFAGAFLTRTRDEWWDHLRQWDVAVSKVLTIDEALADPQVLHRQMKVEAGHLAGETVYQVGIGPKLSETPGSIRRLGVAIGADTDRVLKQQGYSSLDIRRLRNQGAVA